MKGSKRAKLLATLLALEAHFLAAGMLHAQTTNIPDAIMERAAQIPGAQFVQTIDSYLIRYQANTTNGNWIRAQGSGLDADYPYPTLYATNRMEDCPAANIDEPPCASKRMSLSYLFSTHLEF